MPRAAKILSARAVSELRWKKTSVDKQGNPIPTPYPVGGAVGLYLTVTKDLGRSWYYRYSSIEGNRKRNKMGLGSYTYKKVKDSEALTLQQAREKAQHWAGVRAKGLDPLTERNKEQLKAAAAVAKSITFKAYAENDFLPMKRQEYKNPDSYRRVKQILDEWVFPVIGHIAIADVERVHAIAVLKQKVGEKRLIDAFVDLPDRCHIYMSQVLRKAKADGLIDQIPFVWKDDLEFAFTTLKKQKKKSWPRPALNYRKLPKFVNQMMALDKPKGARPDVQCMMFGILTQARSNEARLVTWEEIDLTENVWHVPASKYKSDNDWAIPLCSEAIKIIKAQPSARLKEGRIFSRLDGGPIHDKNLSGMGRILGYKEEKHPDKVSPPRWVVFNGFRRTFRTWAQAKEFNNEASELAMKHLDTAKLKQVYIDDPDGRAMFDRRKMINDHYQKFAIKGQDLDNVVSLSGRKKRNS